MDFASLTRSLIHEASLVSWWNLNAMMKAARECDFESTHKLMLSSVPAQSVNEQTMHTIPAQWSVLLMQTEVETVFMFN